jgi:hypothetical protein
LNQEEFHNSVATLVPLKFLEGDPISCSPKGFPENFLNNIPDLTGDLKNECFIALKTLLASILKLKTLNRFQED